MTFNDANVTGNYTVLHAKLSKPFRDQFPPEQLEEVFKVFHEQRIDFDLIAAKPPIASEPARVNDSGVLMLHGHFDTTPSQRELRARIHHVRRRVEGDPDQRPAQVAATKRTRFCCRISCA